MCMPKIKIKKNLWVKSATTVNSIDFSGFTARIHMTHFVQMDWPLPFGITKVIPTF